MVLTTSGGVAAAEAAELPNVLVVMTDDQRADLMSVMDDTLEIFGSQGVTFPEAYATTPLCCPSRASIFSGRFAHNHGVQNNEQAERLDQATTAQRYLQDAGYRTALVGKFLNRWPVTDDPPYFDRWSMRAGKEYFGVTYNVDGTLVDVPGYSTDFEAATSVELIQDFEAEDDRPWLMYVAPVAPHDPIDPSPEYEDVPVDPWQWGPAVAEVDKSDKPPWVQATRPPNIRSRVPDDSRRTLMSVDDMVEDIFQALGTLGEAQDTLAFFLSDNGYLWGEHDISGKQQPYTESILLPFMARWPGHLPEGTVDPRPAANIDLAPTILDAAGVSSTVAMDGSSLLGPSSRTAMLTEAWPQGGVVPRWASIRGPTYQYVEYYDEDDVVVFRELYDLQTDPWQLDNALGNADAADDPDVAALHGHLAKAVACQGSTGAAGCESALTVTTVDVHDVVLTEGDSGTMQAVFRVSLSRPQGQAVVIPFATEDGTAVAPDDYTAASGTATIRAGRTDTRISVPVVAESVEETDESFFLELSPPSNATLVDARGAATIDDDDTPPVVSVGDVQVAEGDSSTTIATFAVSLSEPWAKSTTVQYATADGTATASTDYTAASGTLTIPPGQSSGQISVPVAGDTTDEPDETFTLQLTAGPGATVGDGQGLGTILDDDPQPTLSVGDVTLTEGTGSETSAALVVSLSNPSSNAVTVQYATADGTANAGTDYTSVSGTLTIPPGQSSGQISVPVAGDTIDEPDETFTLQLTAGTGTTVGDGQGLATIVDDDPQPSLSVGDVTLTEGTGSETTTGFVVSLSSPSSKTVSVQYATASGTATSGSDYKRTQGKLVIPAGASTGLVTVIIIGDTLDEDAETFLVMLSSPVGATIADGQGVGTIVDDDPG